MCVATINIMKNTTLPVKAKCSVFIYSLLVQIMYITVNKATFMVNDTIKAITKNNIKLINTTSLSDSKSYLVKWQHISTISLSMLYTIQYCSIKNKRTNKIS